MNPNQPPERHPPFYNRIAYQYLYGRRPAYGYAPAVPGYGVRPLAGLDASTLEKAFFPGIDDGPQTVEQAIEQGYFAVPQSDPETGFLEDKKHTSWLALDDVLGQIHKRNDIYKQNMLDLEWAQCYAFNELARGGWPASEEKHALYQRRQQDLRSEQRAERITFWRDVSRLRERIPESAQQYLSAFRKSEILDDTRGGLP